MVVLSEKLKMDSNGTSSAKVDQKITNGVASVLTYAACEWLLIFLMFIDALLSYLLVWFARYCRLQLPCFLCSKLHHLFHWRLLLCSSHRSEVSSLTLCQIHDNNLADCRGMCDDCLLSFTKKTTPNPETHRLLLGKLGFELLMKSDFGQPRSCSCCDKPWRTRHNSQRLLQLGFLGRNAAGKPNIPVPRRINRRGSGSLKKTRDNKRIVVASDYVAGKKGGGGGSCSGGGGGGMAHVGYTELKITSDSESEFPFSDEDGFVSMNEASEKSALESPSQKSFENKIFEYKQLVLQDNQNKNTPVQDEKIVEASMPELILLDDIPQHSVQADENTTVLCQLISLVDACPSSSIVVQEDTAGTVSEKQNDARPSDSSSAAERILNINMSEAASCRDEQTTNSPSREPSSENQNHVHESENVFDSAVKVEVCEAVVERKVADSAVQENASGIVEKEHSTVQENVSGFIAKELSSKEELGFNEDSERLTLREVSGSVAKDGFNEDDGANADSESLTLQNVSGPVAKEHSSKEENGLNEDSEPLTLQNIPNEESSKTRGDEESLKVMEAQSISNGTPRLHHSASLESFDGSISSDTEGENIVDRLKRQVEHGKKWLSDLQKELEEERNASAIAANQAMAMITRLQEEKAALHMEALQYLRMMDEQAEYDVDALEKANDILAEKEKEIQDLETELEYYRLKFPNESREEIIGKGNSDLKERSITSTMDETKSKAPTETKGSQKPSFINSSLLEIEKEKAYISECLRNLEKKLYQFTDGRLSECAENGSSHPGEVLINDGSLETEENSLLRHEDDAPVCNGEPPTEEAVIDPSNKCHAISTETDCNKDKNKLIRFEDEISDLKDRLETFNADRDFLECSFTTLEKGKEGLQLIQEIAHQLQELRNLGIRRR